MKRFNNWSIGTKVMSISMLTIAIILAGMLFYFIPLVKGKLMEEKKLALNNVADVAVSLMASYEARIKAGEVKLEDAQKMMVSNTAKLRYNGNEYFFIMN
ncbi:MAG: cache domain-containing protein, partial [Syntrophorhabdaceae bacterium]|nr:cache domain-containing protein [Syntrophorhabdaceae bacterium]